MQCAGFLSGLQVADAFIRSGTYRRILLVGAECHASFYPWTDDVWAVLFGESDGPISPEDRAWGTAHRDRAVIFGDGGGAFVLEAHADDDGRGFLGFEMRTDGNHWDKLHVPGGGSASFPYFTPEMFEDNRTIPDRRRDGRSFVWQRRRCRRSFSKSCEKHGLSTDDLSLLLMHQANLRINEAVQKSLKLPDEKVFNNIQIYGNTTAATLPLVYHEAKKAGQGSARRPRLLHRARRRAPLGRGLSRA